MLHEQMNLLLKRFIGRIVLHDIRLVLGEGIAAADAPITENEAAISRRLRVGVNVWRHRGGLFPKHRDGLFPVYLFLASGVAAVD